MTCNLIGKYFLVCYVLLEVVLCYEPLIPPPPLITDQPYFDPSMPKAVITHVGKTANLYCRVHSIANRTVSWIRSRDLRILTVNRYTYITDLRHEAFHQEGTNQWTLKIQSVQPRDAGYYECQISTKPLKSFVIKLIVLEPRVEVLGAPDLYVQRSSMINLTCIMHNVAELPAAVHWYHNNKKISYSSSRGGISHVVEKGPTTISYLLIQQATNSDSGIYTCSPSNMNSKNITVYVIKGEVPAAMQANNSVGILHQPLSGHCLLIGPSLMAASLRYLWHAWLHIT